jgi:hypothetical protein
VSELLGKQENKKSGRLPSATETIRGISASIACKIASAASRGGTNTDVAKGLSSLAAFFRSRVDMKRSQIIRHCLTDDGILFGTSRTVEKTGSPRWVSPPLFGDTPPTTFVP